jgi:hypothetical protein
VVAGCSSGSTAPHVAATGPVQVPVPAATAALVLRTCRDLLARLPNQLDKGVQRRPATPDPTRTAAWGDPPITLRCGVPLPDQTVTPIVIDGLPLVTTNSAGVVTWTTPDRAVNVSLDIPTSYQNQAYDVQPLVPLLLALPKPDAAPGA